MQTPLNPDFSSTPVHQAIALIARSLRGGGGLGINDYRAFGIDPWRTYPCREGFDERAQLLLAQLARYLQQHAVELAVGDLPGFDEVSAEQGE